MNIPAVSAFPAAISSAFPAAISSAFPAAISSEAGRHGHGRGHRV
jgi:hypothetical protein